MKKLIAMLALVVASGCAMNFTGTPAEVACQNKAHAEVTKSGDPGIWYGFDFTAAYNKCMAR